MKASTPPTIIYVLLGSNHEPIHNLRQAIRKLRDDCQVMAVSSVYETAAQGSGSGTYWNAAAKIATEAGPADFKLNVLRAIERRLHRDRGTPAVVTIDLDIALWGSLPISYGDKPWHSPSADILHYAYVAIPLAELAPDLIHPETGQTFAEIAAQFDRGSVRRLDADIS